MEDYTYHLVEGEELSLGAHMLEVNPTLSSQRPRLEVHPLGIGGKQDPARLVFTADAGDAVVVAMSDMRERFRLVGAAVQTLPLPAPMPMLPVGHAVWRSKPDFVTAATCWMTAGAAHHTVMSTQTTLDTWAMFARAFNVELARIEEGTTIRSFEAELRANSVYYRLAAPL